MTQQGAHVLTIARKHADADAGSGHQRLAVDFQRRAERARDARCSFVDLVGGLDDVEHDDEFVAAHAHHDVLAAHGVLDAL
jgi:hypothetical protein